MKLRNVLAVLVLAGSVAGFTQATSATTYKVDPVHSSVIFKIFHFNTAPFYGRFDAPMGSFVLDEDASKVSFDIELPVDKVDTGNDKRDAHLKSPDFFNAKQFPTIHFKSTSVKATPNNSYEVDGDLTIHGVTKSTKITVEKTAEGQDPKKEKAGLATTFTVRRSDFGMNFMPGALGDDVTLMIGIEGAK